MMLYQVVIRISHLVGDLSQSEGKRFTAGWYRLAAAAVCVCVCVCVFWWVGVWACAPVHTYVWTSACVRI